MDRGSPLSLSICMMDGMDEMLTTEQVADMLKPQMSKETRTERKIRFTHAARKLRARGVEPIAALGEHGQRLWPKDQVIEALSKPERLGNRTRGPERSEAGKLAWATRRANGSNLQGNLTRGPERSEACRKAWVTRKENLGWVRQCERNAQTPEADTPSPA